MQDTLFHARQPILPNEENRQTKIMSSNTRLPSYVHTAIILFVLCVICTTLLAAAATTKSGAWNAYTRDFGAECKAKQNRIVEQYRCVSVLFNKNNNSVQMRRIPKLLQNER